MGFMQNWLVKKGQVAVKSLKPETVILVFVTSGSGQSLLYTNAGPHPFFYTAVV